MLTKNVLLVLVALFSIVIVASVLWKNQQKSEEEKKANWKTGGTVLAVTGSVFFLWLISPWIICYYAPRQCRYQINENFLAL